MATLLREIHRARNTKDNEDFARLMKVKRFLPLVFVLLIPSNHLKKKLSNNSIEFYLVANQS